MEKDIEKTKVVFRKYPDESIIALFPEVPADYFAHYCLSYQRLGQHAAACYSWVVADTKPATPDEYAEIKDELERLGYDLEIRLQESQKMRDARRAEAHRIRG